jgi:2-(1,2-epoxy-1,2-dihydrophenyl)acetyl-CoA isomerase
MPLILTENEQSVTTITLNRPEVLNSFNREMSRELQNALTEARTAPEVRAIVLTGAGRGFCAGQDLAEAVPPDGGALPDLGDIVRDSYNPVIRIIRHAEKPVICAVNGVAAGAGANLALACDIVIAAENASFVQSFSRIGVIPDSGGTFFLPRLVGLARATALMMLAEKVSAADAQAMGMIWMVAPAPELMATASELARTLAKMPTRGLGLTKRGLNAAFGNQLDAQLDLEEQLQREAGRTDDYAEGVRAFLEKRRADFTGR